jgi:hypothetical protein
LLRALLSGQCSLTAQVCVPPTSAVGFTWAVQKSPSFSLRVWPGGGLHNFFTPSAPCNARVVPAHPGHSCTAAVCAGGQCAGGASQQGTWALTPRVLPSCSAPPGPGLRACSDPCALQLHGSARAWLLAGWPATQPGTHKSHCWHPSTLGRRHHPMDGCHAGACEAGAGPPQILPHASVGGRRHSNPIGVCYVLARGRGDNSLHLLHPSSTAEFLWRPRATPELLGVVLWHMGGHVNSTAWGESPRQPPTYVGRARLRRVCSALLLWLVTVHTSRKPPLCACGAP